MGLGLTAVATAMASTLGVLGAKLEACTGQVRESGHAQDGTEYAGEFREGLMWGQGEKPLPQLRL